MDESIVKLVVPGMIGLGLGVAYVYAEVENFRYRDENYRPLIWRGINFLFREAKSELKYKKFQAKRRIHKIRYPIRTDSEGYILQRDAPLLEENDHTKERNDNGFLVAGRNETDVIESLDELVGFSVEQLEHRMYPDNQTFEEAAKSGYLGSNSSFGGFLKESERLIPRLATDNDYVLSRDLTHQDIAKPLLYIHNLIERTHSRELKFKYDGN